MWRAPKADSPSAILTRTNVSIKKRELTSRVGSHLLFCGFSASMFAAVAVEILVRGKGSFLGAVLAGLAGALAIIGGVRVYHPSARRAWCFLAVFVLSLSSAWGLMALPGLVSQPMPDCVAASLVVIGCELLGGSVVGLIRRQRRGLRLGSIVEMAMMATAGVAPVIALLVLPGYSAPAAVRACRVIVEIAPLFVALCGVRLGRIVLWPLRGLFAPRMLCAFFLTATLSSVFLALDVANVELGSLGLIAALFLLGTAALHRSMTSLGKERVRKEIAGTGFAFAALATPLLTMAAIYAMSHRMEIWPFIGIEAAVTVLVVWHIQLLVTARDHSLRSAEHREKYFRTVLDNVGDLVVVLDKEGQATYVSPSSERVLGRTSGELMGGFGLHTVHPRDRELAEALVAQSLDAPGHRVAGQLRLIASDGAPRLLSGSATSFEHLNGDAVVVVGMHDVTEQRRLEKELAHQAMHDELTGMPNRALILDRCAQMLSRSTRARTRVAALFVDLDDFKVVNNTFGHATGDALLIAVARRLTAAVRGSDTVGRLGGDEFVVLTEDEEPGLGPELIAERVLQVLHEPFYLHETENVPLLMTASIGIAEGPRETAGGLLRDADVALYRAKALGKRRYVTFAPEMYSAVKSHLQLEMDLRDAVTSEQFFLVYQPTLDLRNLKVTGVEALIRWRHPTRGVVPPSEFIPIMEETGVIVDVGRWVLATACMQAAKWHRDGMPLTMSVNLSARQLDSDELVGYLEEALSASQLNPGSLTLEITETTLMRDADKTADCLRRLHALGVRIAIDDFGTGYCSFGYLQAFPLDVLKIDQSFVSRLSESDDARTLVRTLVRLGTELGLVTLAEGIEEESQLQELLKVGCQAGQGFLFAKPLEPAALEELMRARIPTERLPDLVSAG